MNSEADRPRILLVCPEFFSYQEKICDELALLGFEVVWWNDRPSRSTFYKLFLRIFPRPAAFFSTQSFIRKARILPKSGFTHVLVVKGEALSRKSISFLKHHFADARLSLYLWDAAANAPNAPRAADLFDEVSTFDPIDAQRFGWRYRPLFSAKNVTSVTPPQTFEHDLCFIGTIHSDRARVIGKVRSQCGKDMSFFVFGYFPSKIVWLARALSDRSIFLDYPYRTSFTSLSSDEVKRHTMRSRAILDIEHPQQKGLTMRTIETLLAGRKLITTCDSITSSRLFDPSRVFVIDREHPTISEDFLAVPFEPIPEELSSMYSLRYWISDVLQLSPKQNAAF